MKKSLLAVMLVASGVTSVSATEILGGDLSGNMTIASDYRFRGISLSQNGPAIQGGVDYIHNTGFYIGNWNSSMRGTPNMNNDDVDSNSGAQMNLYGGWKKDVYKGVTVDIGYITYNYPTSSTWQSKVNYNTAEVYAGLGYGPLAVKYSQSTTNYFGLNNSSGSQYLEANLKQSFAPISPKLKDLNLVAHYGNTKVANYTNLNYNDMNVGLVYNLPEKWDLGVLYYTNSSMAKQFKDWNSAYGTKFYSNAVVFNLTKTF